MVKVNSTSILATQNNYEIALILEILSEPSNSVFHPKPHLKFYTFTLFNIKSIYIYFKKRFFSCIVKKKEFKF